MISSTADQSGAVVATTPIKAPYLAADPAGLAPLPGLPITRKVHVGVGGAAIIAGMLVLMRAINDVEDGRRCLNETSRK